MLNNESLKLFTFHKLKGIGPATLKRLASYPDFLTASIEELKLREKKVAKALENKNAFIDAQNLVEIDILEAEKNQTRIISFTDKEFPSLLKETPDCPAFIYIRGCLPNDAMKSIAIIGTRNPTNHGAIITKRITDFFIDNDWSIVSGLAIGCDSIAHRAAVEKNSHTIAVLAHGLHTIAPKENNELASKIIGTGGALITEHAFGIDPIPQFFAKRNRIQAGLSQGVVMVQSDIEGGSLHASRASIEYNRLLAVPFPTSQDIENKEKKIEANILLCSNNKNEKLLLLKCTDDRLNLIQPIRDKEDYIPLLDRLSHCNI